MRASLSMVSLVILGLIAGCGDDDGPTPMPDGGLPPDTGPMLDGGPPDTNEDIHDNGTCTMPRVIEGMFGEVMVTGDTSDMEEGIQDLGTACGNDASLRFAPQDILEYRVPGTGPVGVTFSLVNDGTDDTFDTVVQIRRGMCRMVPMEPFSCFDDFGGDIRSQGGFAAMGGDTVFIVVTGYGETMAKGADDQGAYTLVLEARENALPVIVRADARLVGDRMDIEIEGTDGDMDPMGFTAHFLDAEGMPAPIDYNGDMMPDSDIFVADWAPALAMTSPYTGVVQVDILGKRVRGGMVTQVSLQLRDAVNALSEPVIVPVRTVNEVGLDDTCDMENYCVRPLTCDATMMTCAASPEIVAACMAATALVIPTPTTTTTSTTVTGTLEMGDGLFFSPAGCSVGSGTPGREHLYTVEVPAGTFDLIAQTDLPGSGETDTVVYVRGACADPLSDEGCNDDIMVMEMMYKSKVEIFDIAPGTHTIFVERWAMSEALGYEMRVSLRPVLPTGSACDPSAVMNRCDGMPCNPATMLCP